jgi:hypothetical protein
LHCLEACTILVDPQVSRQWISASTIPALFDFSLVEADVESKLYWLPFQDYLTSLITQLLLAVVCDDVDIPLGGNFALQAFSDQRFPMTLLQLTVVEELVKTASAQHYRIYSLA